MQASVLRRPRRVVIVGQGYVGLPLAVRAAEAGHRVVGFDTDEQRIKQLTVGESHTPDVSNLRLRAVLAAGAYRPTLESEDCEAFEVAVIAVPTPLRDGAPDLSHIDEAARLIGPHLRPGATVILESTTYPGTTRDRLGPHLSYLSGLPLTDFRLGYSPERIDPGNRSWRLENTPKIVSGIDRPSLRAIESFYSELIERTVPVADCETAELAKLLENTFRQVNIALVNELATLTHDLGLDIWRAIDAAASKPFGFMRFSPGPGVGGHCLPIDPAYLSWTFEHKLGRPFRFADLAAETNARMPRYVVRRLTEGLDRRGRPVRGARILLLGLAYKPGTADIRETPTLPIALRLHRLGADVRIADPNVPPDDFPLHAVRAEATAREFAEADAVVLLTDHIGFDYPELRRCARYVLDCRRRLAHEPTDSAAQARVETL